MNKVDLQNQFDAAQRDVRRALDEVKRIGLLLAHPLASAVDHLHVLMDNYGIAPMSPDDPRNIERTNANQD